MITERNLRTESTDRISRTHLSGKYTTTETTIRIEDGMDSPIETDKIEKWKKAFNHQFSIYKDFPDSQKEVFDIYQIDFMLAMLDDLNSQSTGKSHTG